MFRTLGSQPAASRLNLVHDIRVFFTHRIYGPNQPGLGDGCSLAKFTHFTMPYDLPAS
jgi:hypothetical protein